MRAFYLIGVGSTGSDISHCREQNHYLVSHHDGLSCSLVIESDLSGQNHRYPKTLAVLQSPHIPYYHINIPEGDLLKSLKRGEREHLNFVQHGLLGRKETEAGMALQRPIGYVASILHRGGLQDKFKADFRDLGDIRRGEVLQLDCWECGCTMGGTASSGRFTILQIFRDIEQETGGGMELTVNSIYVCPNFWTISELSSWQLANTAAFAREEAAIQVGYRRHSRITADGRERPTTDPINARLFVRSDISEGGIFHRGDLIAAIARDIEWLTKTPIGEVFRAELVNVEAAVLKPGIPQVNRIGGASIYFPGPEEEAFREARLNVRVIDSALGVSGQARQRAHQVLSEKRLLEDFNRGDLSLLIDERRGERLSRLYLESFEEFSPKSKKPLRQMGEIEMLFNLHEEEVLPKLLNEIKKSRRALRAEMEELPATIVQELLDSDGFGQTRKISRQMLHAMKTNLAQVQVRAGQEAQREGELRATAENLRTRIVKYPTLSWWRRLLFRFRLKKAVRRYQDYLYQIANAAVTKHLKTEAANLMKVLVKSQEKAVSRLEEVDTALSNIRKRNVERYQALEIPNYPNRGIGQALLPGSFAQRFNESEVPEEAFHTISSKLSQKVQELISGHELSDPQNTLERFLAEQVRQTFHSFISQPTSEDVTKLLLDDPDRDKKIRSLIIQASETTPAYELDGGGMRINVLGIKGGETSPLYPDIQRVAKELQVPGDIKVADIEDASQIILLRSEIGRDLPTIKVLESCEREYQLLGKERYRCHREPLLGLLPGIVNPPSKEEAYKLLICGLASSAIVQDPERQFFSHKTLSWGEVTVGSPEKEEDVRAWAKDYKVALDAAGRYIFLIHEEGFKAAKEALEALKKTYRKESWSSVIDEVMEELKYLAKLYHQEV